MKHNRQLTTILIKNNERILIKRSRFGNCSHRRNFYHRGLFYEKISAKEHQFTLWLPNTKCYENTRTLGFCTKICCSQNDAYRFSLNSLRNFGFIYQPASIVECGHWTGIAYCTEYTHDCKSRKCHSTKV